MNKELEFYYQDLMRCTSANCLLSGASGLLAAELSKRFINHSYKHNRLLIVIDFMNEFEYSQLLKIYGYQNPAVYSIDMCNYYSLMKGNNRHILEGIRKQLKIRGYSEDKINSTERYMATIIKLARYEYPDGNITEEFLDFAAIPKYVNEFLDRLEKMKQINHYEREKIENEYYETAGEGGKVIDSIRSSLRNMLYDSGKKTEFSIHQLLVNKAVIVNLSDEDESGRNQAFMSQFSEDIIEFYEKHNNIAILVSEGITSHIDKCKKFIQKLKQNASVLYVTKDIFSGICDMPDKADDFMKYFEYILFSRHDGSSAAKIQEYFDKTSRVRNEQTDSKDLRLFSGNVIDILLNRNRTVAVRKEIYDDFIYKQSEIIKFPDNVCIYYNRTSGEHEIMSI